jgi:tetratricopeptide (TPR) repeat protein
MLTAPGGTFGREAYAAPELLLGARASAQTDLYALGVIFWQMLAKKRYFTVPRETSAAAINPEVPAELDAIARKALAVDPSKRFQSAFEFREALLKHLDPMQGPSELRHALTYLNTIKAKRRNEVFQNDIEAAAAFATTSPAAEPSRTKDSQATDVIVPVSRKKERSAMSVLFLVLTASSAIAFFVWLFASEGGEPEPQSTKAAIPREGPVAAGPNEAQESVAKMVSARAEMIAAAPVIAKPPLRHTLQETKVPVSPVKLPTAVKREEPELAEKDWASLAVQLITENDLTGAEDAAQKALQAKPTAGAYALLASCQKKLGKAKAAERTLSLGLSQYPDDRRLRRQQELLQQELLTGPSNVSGISE